MELILEKKYTLQFQYENTDHAAPPLPFHPKALNLDLVLKKFNKQLKCERPFRI